MDAKRRFRDDVVMTAYPRCAALLRDGTSCGRTVAAGSDFCEALHEITRDHRRGDGAARTDTKPRATTKQMLRGRQGATVDGGMTTAIVATASADPATVRPTFATAAAEDVDQLTASSPLRES